MASTADIRMNQATVASDGSYVYAEAADGSLVKISKASLAILIKGLLPVVSTSTSGLMPTSGFIYRGIVTTQDFDSLVDNGTYQISNTTGANAPTTYGVMAVFSISSMALQIVASAVHPFSVFFRVKGFGEPKWKNWVTLNG